MLDHLLDQIFKITTLPPGAQSDEVFLPQDKILLFGRQWNVISDPGLDTAPIPPGRTVHIGDFSRLQQQFIYSLMRGTSIFQLALILTITQQLSLDLIEYFLSGARPWKLGAILLFGNTCIIALFALELFLVAFFPLPAIEVVKLSF